MYLLVTVHNNCARNEQFISSNHQTHYDCLKNCLFVVYTVVYTTVQILCKFDSQSVNNQKQDLDCIDQHGLQKNNLIM